MGGIRGASRLLKVSLGTGNCGVAGCPEGRKVLGIGWKDQNAVFFFFITASNRQNAVNWLRRRLVKTIKNTPTTPTIFEKQAQKDPSTYESIRVYNSSNKQSRQQIATTDHNNIPTQNLNISSPSNPYSFSQQTPP